MDQIDEDIEEEIEEEEENVIEEAAEEERKPKKRRRRRRRRKGQSSDVDGTSDPEGEATVDDQDIETAEDDAPEAPAGDPADTMPEQDTQVDAKPKAKRSSSRKKTVVAADAVAETADAIEGEAPVVADLEPQAEATKPKRTRVRKAKKDADAEASGASTDTDDSVTKKPVKKRAPRKTKAEKEAEATASEPVVVEVAKPTEVAQISQAPSEPVSNSVPVEPVATENAPEKADDPAKPRRRGWWSLGR